ncbi:amidohydrolase family protein [Mycoplasmopsis citelli]|uniref:amidohydrolase n=1 Tax=Mycoplasmopsis citelli TaxID=171281 RepID=UPI0021145202|nr:amidohydrolase family protein [Mycoplasmopsis citelli]UUD36348.1 amidohydrolase family protein [Mycoplasmopsis citelli]
MKTTAFINGKVYLSNEQFAQAFLLKKDKFLKVGSNKEILSQKPSNIINLEGKVVIPGFIDSHVHFFYSAKYMHYLNISSAKSFADIANLIKQYQSKHNIKQNSVLIGYGLSELNLKESKLPTREDLDHMLEKVALFLWRNDYHSGVYNTKALKRLKSFKKNIIDPGSIIELDEQGWPTGFVREMITWRVDSLMSNSHIKREANYLKDYVKYANSLGLTGIYTCDLRNSTWEQSLEQIQLLKDELSLEVYHQLWLTEPKWLEDFINKKETITLPDNHKLGAIKVFADGTVYSKTAAFDEELAQKFQQKSLKPYTEDSDFDKYIKRINKLDLSITTHAIGNYAIASVIKNYQKVSKTNKARNAIIHASYLDDNLLTQLSQSNIPVAFEMCSINYKFADQLHESFLPFQSALKKQVRVGMSTDHLVFPLDPLNNIYAALNHPNKEQRVTIYDAIDAYTKGSAYFMNAEKIMGQIKKGYLANFILYEEDIFNLNNFEQLKTIKPFQTWFRGKVVWSKKKENN